MINPYAERPDTAFWRRAIAGVQPDLIDPVGDTLFKISECDRVATAGSCFAQRLAHEISAQGFNYYVPEDQPRSEHAVNENFGVFSARYGNIYTSTQLLQLFERAYGVFCPRDDVWVAANGNYIDPFRPRIQENGFLSPDALRVDREAHFAAVREMFEKCDVFILTLGLTECWASDVDDAIVSLPPGVPGVSTIGQNYSFHNLTTSKLTSDLMLFVDRMRSLNPSVRIVLTVSPVAITATYEQRHVLVSNGYTKAALRVVAEEVCRARQGISYFPSYEIIAGPAAQGLYLTADRRHVTPAGVKHVMSIFSRHYLNVGFIYEADAQRVSTVRSEAAIQATLLELEALQQVVCDEEQMDADSVAALTA